MGHADNQIRNKATRQAGAETEPLQLIYRYHVDNNENRIVISPIKATLEFSVAKDETPGAPMLGVIALVKNFFFQNAPKGK